jgi:hypothetical protein
MNNVTEQIYNVRQKFGRVSGLSRNIDHRVWTRTYDRVFLVVYPASYEVWRKIRVMGDFHSK